MTSATEESTVASAFAIALMRPILYLVLYCLFVYWIAKAIWHLMPEGRIKSFLFKRRGREARHQRGWY
jgi:hypothetical protein